MGIIMDKKTLLEVRNVIEDIKLNGINEGYIRELYRLLGNSEIPLIFDENSLNTAAFKPKQMKIIASLSKCKQWTKDMLETSIKHFDVGDEELAKSYLLVSLLAHLALKLEPRKHSVDSENSACKYQQERRKDHAVK